MRCDPKAEVKICGDACDTEVKTQKFDGTGPPRSGFSSTDFIIHNNGFLKTQIWTLEAGCWRPRTGETA
jgi:hypothetical protein